VARGAPLEPGNPKSGGPGRGAARSARRAHALVRRFESGGGAPWRVSSIESTTLGRALAGARRAGQGAAPACQTRRPRLGPPRPASSQAQTLRRAAARPARGRAAPRAGT
jgi:hypothetical protein